MDAGSNPIVVTAKQCRNLSSYKEQKFTCFTRVEFGDGVLGESAKLEVVPDKEVDFSFSAMFDCGGNMDQWAIDEQISRPMISKFLDEQVSRPIIISILEAIPKDKKSKEDKSVLIIQMSIDILPLLRGQCCIDGTCFLPVLTEANLQSDDPKLVELDYSVATETPLLSEAEISDGNLLSVNVHSVYSVPDSWQPGGYPYTFTIALPMPISDDEDNPLSIAGGILRSSPDKDSSAVSKQWAWPNVPNLQGPALNISNTTIETVAIEDEKGDINKSEDINFRLKAERNKPRIVWNASRRCWLSKKACKRLETKILACSIWPVEIIRLNMPTPGKGGKSTKDDEVLPSFHGIAYVNFAPLLYPGVSRIVGAYLIKPFNEGDFMQKTSKSKSTMALLGIIKTASRGARSARRGKKGSNTKLNSSQEGSPSESVEATPQAETKTESYAYLESRAYLKLEIVLETSLIPKRTVSVLAKRVSEYIPSRPALPKRVGGAEKAIQDFHKEVGNVITLLLAEYRTLIGDTIPDETSLNNQKDIEERRRKLIFELNSSGKYYAFKEKLKQAVVRIVREKYVNTVPFTDQQQLQTFMSKLYMFLVDQMHVAVNKVLSLEDPKPQPPTFTTAEMMKQFAHEAEVARNYDLAEFYYKERLARSDCVADYWFDYGAFCLLVEKKDMAEQCFYEAVSLDQSHIPSLLAYGMMCCLSEHFEEAETFFELATTTDPENIIAWIMTGLYYENVGNRIMSDMAYQKALRLNSGPRTKTLVNFAASIDNTSRRKSTLKAPSMGSTLKQQSSVSGGHVPQVYVRPPTLSGAHPSSSNTKMDSETVGANGVGQNAETTEDTTAATATTPAPAGTSAPEPSKKPILVADSSVSFKEEVASAPVEDDAKTNTAENTDDKRALTSTPTSLPVKETGSLHNNAMTTSAISFGEVQTNEYSPDEEDNQQSCFLQTASYLLDIYAMKFAEMALANELDSPEGGPSLAYNLAYGRLLIYQNNFEAAIECLQSIVKINCQECNAYSLLGYAYYWGSDIEEAKQCFERTVSFVDNCVDIQCVYIALADIYLREKQYKKMKDTALQASRISPSPVSWRAVGIACYYLNELQEAEDALSEANILNNTDPIVWGYLTLVCLKLDRGGEAEQAYKFALKAKLSDTHLLEEIKELRSKVNETLRTYSEASNIEIV